MTGELQLMPVVCIGGAGNAAHDRTVVGEVVLTPDPGDHEAQVAAAAARLSRSKLVGEDGRSRPGNDGSHPLFLAIRPGDDEVPVKQLICDECGFEERRWARELEDIADVLAAEGFAEIPLRQIEFLARQVQR